MDKHDKPKHHVEGHKHPQHEKKIKSTKANKTMAWQILSLVLIIALIGSFFWGSGNSEAGVENTLSSEEAGQQMMDFITANLIQPGMEATLDSVTEENGVYKLEITAGGQQIQSYVTKDGKMFFPQGMDVAEFEEQVQIQKEEQAQAAAPVDVEKTAKPYVEMFVMSHCPYGTQIVKGMIPVMELLGTKADIEVKFCDYAMHGEIELKEQMNQYCIQYDFPDKFIPYLKCFLAEGKGDECIAEVGVDKAALETCVAEVDVKYKIMENFESKEGYRGQFPGFDAYKEETTKYEVRGSPTLVINGGTVQAGRDAASLLKAICNAFTDDARPAECDQELDAASPSPGFGFDAGSGAATGGCAS